MSLAFSEQEREKSSSTAAARKEAAAQAAELEAELAEKRRQVSAELKGQRIGCRPASHTEAQQSVMLCRQAVVMMSWPRATA